MGQAINQATPVVWYTFVLACRPGQEGTRNCNYRRLCGSLLTGVRDVGAILLGEGLAHPYVCGATSCPQRRPWSRPSASAMPSSLVARQLPTAPMMVFPVR